MHLLFYFHLLVNKINDGNPVKAKLGIFIESRGTSVENLWKGATDHESLKTTALEGLLEKEDTAYGLAMREEPDIQRR